MHISCECPDELLVSFQPSLATHHFSQQIEGPVVDLQIIDEDDERTFDYGKVEDLSLVDVLGISTTSIDLRTAIAAKKAAPEKAAADAVAIVATKAKAANTETEDRKGQKEERKRQLEEQRRLEHKRQQEETTKKAAAAPANKEEPKKATPKNGPACFSKRMDAALHGGIREGDVFGKVDGVAVAAQSSEKLTKLVLGAEGSRVALDILRNGEPIALTIYRAEINYEKSFQSAELHKIRARQERREGVRGGLAAGSESRARDVGNVPNNATALSNDSRPILSSAAAQAASQAMDINLLHPTWRSLHQETLARMQQTISAPQSGISDVAPLANEAIAQKSPADCNNYLQIGGEHTMDPQIGGQIQMDALTQPPIQEEKAMDHQRQRAQNRLNNALALQKLDQSGMKFYVHLEAAEPDFTMSVAIDAADTRTVTDLKALFLKTYNSKFGQSLDAADFMMLTSKKKKLDPGEKIVAVGKSGTDLFITPRTGKSDAPQLSKARALLQRAGSDKGAQGNGKVDTGVDVLETSTTSVHLRTVIEKRLVSQHDIQMRVHDSEIEELARALHESEIEELARALREKAAAEKDTAEAKCEDYYLRLSSKFCFEDAKDAAAAKEAEMARPGDEERKITEPEEAGAAAAGVSVAASSRAPLLQTDVKQVPCTMSVAEAEALFMFRFNLSPSDGSSGAALTAASTAALGSAAAPEEAPAPAPAESMSRAEPAAAGAVTSFVLDSFQCQLTMEAAAEKAAADAKHLRAATTAAETKWKEENKRKEEEERKKQESEEEKRSFLAFMTAEKARIAEEAKIQVVAEAKAAAEAAAAAAAAAAEAAEAEMARALAESTLLLEASKGLHTRVVHYNGENDGYGLQVPPYWRNKTGINFVATNKFVRDALQRFMVESSCSLTCCVATTQTRVVSVERVENEPLWRRYQSRKGTLKQNCATHAGILSLSTATNWQPAWCCNVKKDKGGRGLIRYILPSCIYPITEGTDSEMSADINEFYLFHGTSLETAMLIGKNGFDPAAASSNCLYGVGSYFAINSCKGHQYSSAKGNSSNLVMLVCRVAMGSPYPTAMSHTQEKQPPQNYDSIFARHGIAHGGQQHHNEYVVFDRHQVYPEYIVRYKV